MAFVEVKSGGSGSVRAAHLRQRVASPRPGRSRALQIAACALLGLTPLSVHACGGGDYDIVPTSLSYYLSRQPGKNIGQIYAETGTVVSPQKAYDLPRAELIGDFTEGPSPKFVAKIDGLLTEARAARATSTQLNLLQDLRDLADSKTATGAEMVAYVEWRLDNFGLFEKAEYIWEKPKPPKAGVSEMAERAAKASPALKPHWIYLQGAQYYRAGDDKKSEGFFDQVLKDYPDDPRAETALFMKGRCKLSQSVKDDYSAPNGKQGEEQPISAAKELFESYLTKYPKGRYVSDVTGWLGGVAYRTGHSAEAVVCYTKQLEMKDHPENFPGALLMLENVLAGQLTDDAESLDEVAQHPQVALALAYHVLNYYVEPSTYSSDDIGKWRQTVLPQLGAAVVKHKELYQGEVWQDRYLALLARAASDSGDQKQALELVALGDKTKTPNDDLLFAKAMVLQRAGKLAEAEKNYRTLLAKFPKSQFAPGARYRLALTLHDQKDDAGALFALAALHGNRLTLRSAPQKPLPEEAPVVTDPIPDPQAVDPEYSGVGDQQIALTIDTILNFAPLAELEKARRQAIGPEREEIRSDLTQVLQQRYLDRDDFRKAATFADLPQIQKSWNDLATKNDKLEKATGPGAAKGYMEMAEFWVLNRKMLPAMPLDSLDSRGELEMNANAGTARAANALALNYEHPEVELESREGLWHAVRWWSKASLTKDPAVAPKALWSIIKARRTIAEVSPYTWQRAIDGQAGEDSWTDYQLILKSYPDSPEAGEVVFWTFAKTYPFNQYDHAPLGFDRDSLSVEWLKTLGMTQDESYYNRYDGKRTKKLKDLAADTEKMDAKEFAVYIKALRDEVRQNVTSLWDAGEMNCMDDLVQFSEVEGVSPEIRKAYLGLRVGLIYTSHMEASISTEYIGTLPNLDPVRDFVDFLELAGLAHDQIVMPTKDLEKDGSGVGYYSPNYPEILTAATEFLAKYPKSPKRETARLLQIRAMVRSARPKEVGWSAAWPVANRWDSQYAPRFFTLLPLDKPKIDAAFKAYSEEFPKPLYPNGLRALHADSELIQGNWGAALDDLVALVDQQTAPELRHGAAGELAYIYDQLDEDSRRTEVLAEIVKRPVARKYLADYVETGGLGRLKDYVKEKLAGR